MTALPKQSIKKINIIAPYFDEKRRLLSALLDDFPNATINVLLQPISCLPPINIQPSDRIKFYDWDENLNEKLEEKSAFKWTRKRLHAKAFQFLSDEEEYLLMGSSNASIAAFGGQNFKAKNEEANLLLKRKKGDWFSDLGITIHAAPIKLNKADFPLLAVNLLTSASKKYSCRINSVELKGKDDQID